MLALVISHIHKAQPFNIFGQTYRCQPKKKVVFTSLDSPPSLSTIHAKFNHILVVLQPNVIASLLLIDEFNCALPPKYSVGSRKIN